MYCHCLNLGRLCYSTTTALCHCCLRYQRSLRKIMYSQSLNFLDYHKILIGNQFGFRRFHSSYMAFMLMMNHVTNALDNGECVIGIFLDFSKAFDTVNHSILLEKIYHYGIRGNVLEWFRSYLSDMCHTMAFALLLNWLHVVYLKGLYLDHYCFWFTLMTCKMYAMNLCPYYLMMIPISSTKLINWTSW